MALWEIFAVVGLISLILEMLVPSMFFLNLAIAGFAVALLALLVKGVVLLIVIYVILSILSVLLLRSVLLKNREGKILETGMDAKYIGKIVKVVEPVTRFSGAITIYDEKWEARVESDDEIPAGSEVKIVKYDSLILTVEKI